MRLSAAKRYEVIRLVEESQLSMKQKLRELGIARSTFYRWYKAYQDDGYESLAPRSKAPRRFWNRPPESIKEQCIEEGLAHPEKSPRELAWHINDKHVYFISESSVYRLLKHYDLIKSPAYILMQASDRFHTTTKRIKDAMAHGLHLFSHCGLGLVLSVHGTG